MQLNQIINNENFHILHTKIIGELGYEISPLRAIELLMFEIDKQRSKPNLPIKNLS